MAVDLHKVDVIIPVGALQRSGDFPRIINPPFHSLFIESNG